MVSIESRAPVHPLLCLITVEDRWIWGCFCKANATSHCANVNGGESKYFHHQAIFCNTILHPLSLFPLRRRCAAHALPMRCPCVTTFRLAKGAQAPKRAAFPLPAAMRSPCVATFCLARLPQTPKRASAGIPGVLLSPKLGAFCNLPYKIAGICIASSMLSVRDAPICNANSIRSI